MRNDVLFSRRDLLTRCGAGFGMIGLANVLAADAPAPNPARAEAAAPSGQGEAHHPSVHERRPVAGRYLRSQAGPGAVSPGQRPASIAGYRTENATGGLMPSPFKFPRCGQSGLPISEIFPQRRQVRGRSLRHPLDAHRHPQPRAVDVHDEQRPSAERSGPATARGCSTAWAPRTRTCPATSCCARACRSTAPPTGATASCPASTRAATSNLPIDYDAAHGHPASCESRSFQRRGAAPAARPHPAAERACKPSGAATTPLLEARIASLEMAFRMQTAAPEAFDLSQETGSRPSEMYGYDGRDRNVFAQNCLLARRLVERGVRVVQIYSGTGQPWDTHGNNDGQHRNLRSGVGSSRSPPCCRT